MTVLLFLIKKIYFNTVNFERMFFSLSNQGIHETICSLCNSLEIQQYIYFLIIVILPEEKKCIKVYFKYQ